MKDIGNKKVFTIDELVSFCEKNDYSKFMSQTDKGDLYVETNWQVKFEDTEDTSTVGLRPLTLKSMHDFSNRNKSYISPDNLINVFGASFKNRPILCNYTKVNGEWDFTSHDVELGEDDEIEYIERPVGLVPESCEPHLVKDEERGKDFLYVNGFLYESYGKRAIDILERKQETRCSVELCILGFSYNADAKCIEFESGYVDGITLLGVNPETGETVEEGMEGARASFNNKDNNNDAEKEDFNKEILKVLNSIEQHLNNSYGEEEKQLENTQTKVTENEGTLVTNENEPIENQEGQQEQEGAPQITQGESFKKGFELSYDDIRTGLYNLLAVVEEQDNEWYYITEVYSDHFVYQGIFQTVYYNQKFTTTDDKLEFDGDREQVYSMYLNAAEKSTIETLRSNYEALNEKYESLNAEYTNFKLGVENEKKIGLQNMETYSSIKDMDEFKNLFKKEEMDKYSLKELTDKCDKLLFQFLKQNFALTQNAKPQVRKIGMPENSEKTTSSCKFGSLFNKN